MDVISANLLKKEISKFWVQKEIKEIFEPLFLLCKTNIK